MSDGFGAMLISSAFRYTSSSTREEEIKNTAIKRKRLENEDNGMNSIKYFVFCITNLVVLQSSLLLLLLTVVVIKYTHLHTASLNYVPIVLGGYSSPYLLTE